MTTETARRTGWIRLGAGTDWSMALLGLGLSIVTAALIAAPTSKLIEVITGSTPGWVGTALWIVPFAFLLLGLPLLLLANRPASVDLDRRLLRVGWRTISFDQLRHVHRMPGGQTPDKVLLQLDIAWDLDARLPLSSDALPDLTLGELEVLLAMLEQAPIEPRPGLPVHSPIADELGPRDGSLSVADGISDALMPFGRVAYAKPTVLLEVERAIRRLRGDDDSASGVRLPDRGDGARAASALMTGVELVPGVQRGIAIMPPEHIPAVNTDYARGFFGSGGGAYRRHRDAVEAWLRSVQVPVVRNYVDTRALGWVVVVVGLLLPWMFGLLATSFLFFYFSPSVEAYLWGTGISFVFWPVVAWAGLLLVHRARIRRYVAARSAALEALGRGHAIPDDVHDFFGTPFPERSYATGVYLFGIVLLVIALGIGLVILSLGFATVNGPYVPQPWQIPVGGALAISSAPILLSVLRWQRFMTGELARAGVEWRLLRGGS